MLNFTGVARAPAYNWEVFMERNHSMNAVQNGRRRIAYVTAPNADEAKRAAKQKHPEFKPISARKV